MKKIIIGLVVVVLVMIAVFVGAYNQIVSKHETITAKWAQVENQLQRRNDLIPNLVNTVKGAAAQESGVLTAVVEARSKATQMNVDIKDSAALAKFQAAQWEVSSSLSKLLAVVENYPTLQSIQAFRDLMTQLEGTENRIAVERKNYNDVVNTYNVMLRTFPTNMVAGMFGFEKSNQFEAQTGAEVAPVVDFSTAPATQPSPVTGEATASWVVAQ